MKLKHKSNSLTFFSLYTRRRLAVCADPKKNWVKQAVHILRYGTFTIHQPLSPNVWERVVFRVVHHRLAGML